MKKIFSILVLLWASAALAASPVPALRFNLDSAGVATISPDGLRGVPYDFRPFAASDGSLILGLTWIDAGRAQLAFYALPLKYDGAPFPVPTPTPTPIPPPVPPVPPVPPDPPPVPVGKLWTVIIHESSNLTPAQSKIATSKAVADWIQSKGHHKAWIVDKDVTNELNESPPSIKEYVGRAKSLPFLFLVSETGTVVSEGPLPDSEAAVIDLLKKYGGN